MSRVKRFTYSILSGYLVMGANAMYTLASVPLALHYLTQPEFGLWALTTQVAGYIALVDMGLTNSISRILIDHKDDKGSGAYGGVIKTGMLVGVAQGFLVMAAGTLVAMLAAPLLGLPGGLWREFLWLLTGQSVLLGFQFATRMLANVLIAHQRYDIPNYAQSVLFFASLLGMWGGFAAGWGVYSYLAGQAIAAAGQAIVNLLSCMRLSLFPGPGNWGRATWGQFKELFAFGRDAFMMGVGWQFISASQMILLTRFLGLDAAAIWSVCTRGYIVLTLFVWRILDFSTPALTEMMVRGERVRLMRRFQEVTVVSASLALVSGTVFVVCNDPFVRLWTAGRIHWSPLNDLLLAISFVLVTVTRANTSFATQTKVFGFLRFIFLVEGSVFVGLTVLARGNGGMTAMLVFSIAATVLFSFPYGVRRTAGYFGLRWPEVVAWYRPTWEMMWRLAPVAFGVWWLARSWPLRIQLCVDAALVGAWGIIALLRYGLGKRLQAEMLERMPLWARGALKQLAAG